MDSFVTRAARKELPCKQAQWLSVKKMHSGFSIRQRQICDSVFSDMILPLDADTAGDRAARVLPACFALLEAAIEALASEMQAQDTPIEDMDLGGHQLAEKYAKPHLILKVLDFPPKTFIRL